MMILIPSPPPYWRRIPNDKSVLDGVRTPIERSAALLKWSMAGEVLIPGVLNVGDIEKTDGCAQAVRLAGKL